MSRFAYFLWLAALTACAGSPQQNSNNHVSASDAKTKAPSPTQNSQTHSSASADNTPPPAVVAAAPAGDHAAERRDFEMLCKALNHDYIDGTLTDYYGRVSPQTELGKQVKAAGNDSVTPGRDLIAAFTKLLGKGNTPGPHCAELVEQIDELE